MLLKRLSALAAVFFLLTAFSSFAYADTFPAPLSDYPTSSDAGTSATVAEQNFGMKSTNISGDSLNYLAPPPELQVKVDGVQTNYGYLVYGDPHDLDAAAGRNRYAGYDLEGDGYTNLAYPPDATPNGANFESEQWITTPWDNSTVEATVQQQTGRELTPTPWDNQQYLSGSGYSDKQYSVNELLINGMNWLNTTTGVGGTNGTNGYAFDTNDGNAIWSNLYQYVNLMMPPTDYTWGVARMWHMQDGYPYYVDIPMAPLISIQLVSFPQLVVVPASATVSVGGTQKYTDTYYPNGQAQGNGQDITTSSAWTDDNTSVATIGASTGLATGAATGSTNITATYTPLGGGALTGTATLTVQQTQGSLVVTPPSATISVGGTQQYTATYTPSGGQPVGVTTQSTWSDSNNLVASIGVNSGLATGQAQGTVGITANYTPPAGSVLTGTATLTVQAQQQQSGGNNGKLTFQATSQPNTINVFTGKIGAILTRTPNTAKWTDTVIATLTTGMPPEPQLGSGEQFDGFTNWSISTASLTYPLKNPNFTFGYPVDPVNGVTTSTSMTSAISGPSQATATAQFREDWSMDGAGIYSLHTRTTMAATPQPFSPSATFTVSYTYTYQVWQIVGYTGGENPQPIWGWGPDLTNTGTASGTASGTLTVNGTGVNSLAN